MNNLKMQNTRVDRGPNRVHIQSKAINNNIVINIII